MAKNKKTNHHQQQQQMSPSKYIRLKGRSLPVVHCYINATWKEEGLAFITVIRQHQSGNYTSGQYLVDTYCLGVKDTSYYFNTSQEEVNEMKDGIPDCMEISYNEAHNIIFGAITYAEEEAETLPHPDFELTKHLLEEDTDNIPLIEYPFGGSDGRPFLAVTTRLEASKYLPKLQQKFGKDLLYVIREEEEEFDEYEEDEEDYDEDEDYDTEDFDSELAKKMRHHLDNLVAHYGDIQKMTHSTYSYVHPEYPSALTLTHNELEALYSTDYRSLPHEVIQQLLDLPRETMIADLNQIILYELGKSCDEVTDEMCDNQNNAIIHALLFLGELKATESLQTVLEILRQNDKSIEFQMQGPCTEMFRPTIYYIGSNQMNALLAFMKEPGLNGFSRSYIITVIITIFINEPERKEEVIEWFRQLLRFLAANSSDHSLYDALMVGLLIEKLAEIHAVELLPEIKELFDLNQVNYICCGEFPEVEEKMNGTEKPMGDYSTPDIYKRYKVYEEEKKSVF